MMHQLQNEHVNADGYEQDIVYPDFSGPCPPESHPYDFPIPLLNKIPGNLRRRFLRSRHYDPAAASTHRFYHL
jgi:hypothetical protein